jgi:uncharacterized protein (DUF1501 family)
MNRRNFLKNMALTAGSISPLARIGGLGLLTSSSFAAAPSSGYKAMVVIHLYGGNDSMNMFIPTDDITSGLYNSYQTARPSIAVENLNLISDTAKKLKDADCPAISVSSGEGNPYYDRKANHTAGKYEEDIDAMYRKGSYHTGDGLGINGMMPEFAELYRTGKLSIVSNVGTLVKPTTKAEIDAETADLPVFLFAHNHQQREIQTAIANKLDNTGWAGKLADSWKVNGSMGLNVSYSGVNRMLIGESTTPLTMRPNGPTSYTTPGAQSGEEIDTFLKTTADSTTSSNIFESFYAKNSKIASVLSESLTTAWASGPDVAGQGTDSYGNALFSSPSLEQIGFADGHGLNDNLALQLSAVAKMISIGKNNLGFNRQVFYISLGGFDTHSGQAEDHATNLRTLSMAVNDFNTALESMGLEENVLTFNTSDFGRSMQSNGDGTDHGWAGHSFMLCGDPSFQGGKTFGTVLDDVSLSSVHAHTKKGRFIPTTSIEQMLAPTLDWFGVDESLMATVLPNLVNFRTDVADSKSSFLSGVFVNEG